jgi:hypothetical protein
MTGTGTSGTINGEVNMQFDGNLLTIVGRERINDLIANVSPSLRIDTLTTAVDPSESITITNIGDNSTTATRIGINGGIQGGTTNNYGTRLSVSNSRGDNFVHHATNNSTGAGSVQMAYYGILSGVAAAATKYGINLEVSSASQDNIGASVKAMDGTKRTVAYEGLITGTAPSGIGLYVSNTASSGATLDTQQGAVIEVDGTGTTTDTIKFGVGVKVNNDSRLSTGFSASVSGAYVSNVGANLSVIGLYGNDVGIQVVNATGVTGGGDVQIGGIFEVTGNGDVASSEKVAVAAQASGVALTNVGVSISAGGAAINYSILARSGRWSFIHDPNLELGINDPEAYGDIVNFGSFGSGVSGGTIVYLDSSGVWQLADATTAATSTQMLAMALGSGPSDGLLIRGYMYSTTWSWTAGEPLYIRNNPGSLTDVAPSSTGEVVRIIGYCTDTSTGQKIYFNPDNSWIEI